ncbi:MAG TPA: hypothetical protein VM888_14875 [Chitinophagaceae bacterium]|jgi:hypothetical protein|nr:hypothetical protein [Chitinophagaceae bacterium]
MIITNPKITGIEPCWAPFHGFSLLFDNPKDGLTPMASKLRKLNSDIVNNPDLLFYKTIADSVTSIGRKLLIHTYLFCPLPSPSYHITVLDGLNEGNLQQVNSQHRPAIDDFLNNFPDSFAGQNPVITFAEDSLLLRKKDWNLSFKLDRLANWGNVSLVATLLPTDPYSSNYSKFIEERRILAVKFRNEFSINVSIDFYPHLTIGYFANESLAESFTPKIDEWTNALKNQAAEQRIIFNSISLYGFMDMTTFFKR